MTLPMFRSGALLALFGVLTLPLARAEDSAFERPPQRTATQILGAEGVKGPGWTVREKVVTSGYLQQFEVESQFGLYRPASRRMLVVRTREIETMARLLKMGGSNAYMDALGKRLVGLPTSLVNVVKDPVGTVKRVPKALGKTFGRVTGFLGGAGQGGTKLSPEELRKSLVAAQKRRLAAELKVDVYSTNGKLQTLLDEIATARYAGEFTVSLASYAIPGGAATAVYSTASYNTLVADMLTDKTADELIALNSATLTKAGMHRYLVRKFIESPRLTPRHQTVITTSLVSLKGVQGRGAILEAALEARNETSAFLQEQQAMNLARYHKAQEPLARVHAIGGLILAQTRSKKFVLLGPVDLIAYDAGAKHVLGILAKAPLAVQSSKRTLHIKGRVTQRFKDEAKALGFTVVTGWPWLSAKDRETAGG